MWNTGGGHLVFIFGKYWYFSLHLTICRGRKRIVENMDILSATARAWKMVSSCDRQESARQQDALCLGYNYSQQPFWSEFTTSRGGLHGMTMTPNMARKPIDPTHGADDQRSCTLPSRVTQTEVGPDRPTEGSMRESKGVTPLCHVVEGYLTSIIVQENPYPLERGPQGKGSHWGSKCPVFFPIPQWHCPESILGGWGYSTFSAYWVFTDTYGPLGFISHLYLPIMSPSDETWRAQDTGKKIEPFRVVRQVLLEVTISHLPQIIRKDQAGVSCIWIQSHVHCRNTEGRVSLKSRRGHSSTPSLSSIP